MSLKKNKNKGKLKRKKSLLLIIICPFIIIVFLQEMIPLFTIMFSGVRTVLQQNAATLDLHMVENRQQALQNEMVGRWGDLTSENELINEILRNYLNEKGISIETFVNNKVHQDEFLQMVFPEMVDFLQRNTTTGNFLIYGNNVPYDNTKWVLVGLVNEDSIFGMSDNLLQVGYIMIAAFFVLGIVILIIVLGFVVEPFKRLLTSVRGGITGLRNYKPSNVKEIDELQSVIKELTEQDIQSANLLKEEKERYKIAVESSQDIFYSYRIEEEKLEIVNSKDFTGVWDKEQFLEEYARINIDAQDYEKFLELFETKENHFTSEIRIRGKGERPYHWVEISGRRVNDIEGEERRIVGCIRNIHQEKTLQQERVAKKLLDSVTGYYRFEVGKTSLDELIEQKMNGSLLLVRIDHFRDITAEFGLTFGDVIIEELSILFSKCCERLNDTRYKIKIRAGEDSLLAFISEPDAEKIRNEMVTLANDFSSLVHQEQLALHIHCGFAPFGEQKAQRK